MSAVRRAHIGQPRPVRTLPISLHQAEKTRSSSRPSLPPALNRDGHRRKIPIGRTIPHPAGSFTGGFPTPALRPGPIVIVGPASETLHNRRRSAEPGGLRSTKLALEPHGDIDGVANRRQFGAITRRMVASLSERTLATERTPVCRPGNQTHEVAFEKSQSQRFSTLTHRVPRNGICAPTWRLANPKEKTHEIPPTT